MPMRDSWPCDSASGSSRGNNSAGRRDGMISISSGASMEHLSAEERACLTFLEETIESLEAEDNSGVSTDNPDHSNQSRNKIMNEMAYLGSISHVSPDGLSVHDDPNKYLPKGHKASKLLVPTPLVLANGNAKLLKKTDFFTAELKPAKLANAPKTAASNQSLGFPTSAARTATSAPSPGRHKPNANPSSDAANMPPPFVPEPPGRHKTAGGALAKDSPPKSSGDPWSDQKHQSVSPHIPVVLLPPPSDFMDEPVPLAPADTLPAGQNIPQTSTRLSSLPALQFPSQPCQSERTPVASPPEFDEHIEANDPPAWLSTSPKGQLSPNELDKLRKKALMKKAPEIVPVVKPVHNQTNASTFGPDASAVTRVQYEEPKSRPNVAPKPKKLPSSIVLKSQKDATPGHTLVSPGDRLMINQQKVHLEALKKLGLLRSDESNSGLCPSPPNKPSPPPAEPAVDPAHVHAEHAEFMAPDNTEFSSLSVQPEIGEGLLTTLRAPSSKPYEMKSASMERSGVGLKSLTVENASRLASQEEGPDNGRPPAAPAESAKRTSIQRTPSESSREPELRRSLPIPVPSQPKTESQKSVRSHGTSVVISPQSVSGEDRRQALRRLGLGLIND